MLLFSCGSEFSVYLRRRDIARSQKEALLRKVTNCILLFHLPRQNPAPQWQSLLVPSLCPRPPPTSSLCVCSPTAICAPRWEQPTSVWLSLGEPLPRQVLQLQWTNWSDGSWQGELGAEQAVSRKKPSSAQLPWQQMPETACFLHRLPQGCFTCWCLMCLVGLSGSRGWLVLLHLADYWMSLCGKKKGRRVA